MIAKVYDWLNGISSLSGLFTFRVLMSTCSLFKVVLVGNRNVGKTSMVTKYCEGQFVSDQAPTYTANFVIKNIYHKKAHYKLCIWDTSGNHSMVSYLEACCSDANAVILVYDVNDKKSFVDLDFWMPEVRKVCDEKAVRVIVGCKTDLLSDERSGHFIDEVYEYAQSKECDIMFASNRIGHDVECVFNLVMEKLCKSYFPNLKNVKNRFSIHCNIPVMTKFRNFFDHLKFCQPKKRPIEAHESQCISSSTDLDGEERSDSTTQSRKNCDETV